MKLFEFQTTFKVQEFAHYDWEKLRVYPKPQDLLASASFRHEAQIVELASLESQNQSQDLQLDFLGELSSRGQDDRYDSQRNYTIEALTPDYTVIYTINGNKHLIYSEFERTRKTHSASLKKISRYRYYFLTPNQQKQYILRIIFQTPGMEQAFWLNLILNQPSLSTMNIITTHLGLLSGHQQFLEPVYATYNLAKLTESGKLKVAIPQRVGLFNFL